MNRTLIDVTRVMQPAGRLAAVALILTGVCGVQQRLRAGPAPWQAARRLRPAPQEAGSVPGLTIETAQGRQRLDRSQIASIVFAGAPQPPPAAAPAQSAQKDRLVLATGKIVETTLVAVTQTQVVTFESVTPRDRVARLDFSGAPGTTQPPARPPDGQDLVVMRDGSRLVGKVLSFDDVGEPGIQEQFPDHLRRRDWVLAPPLFPLHQDHLFLRDGGIISGQVLSLMAFAVIETAPAKAETAVKSSGGASVPVQKKETGRGGQRRLDREQIGLIVLDGKLAPLKWPALPPNEDAVMLDDGDVRSGTVNWPEGKTDRIYVGAESFDAGRVRAIRLGDDAKGGGAGKANEKKKKKKDTPAGGEAAAGPAGGTIGRHAKPLKPCPADKPLGGWIEMRYIWGHYCMGDTLFRASFPLVAKSVAGTSNTWKNALRFGFKAPRVTYHMSIGNLRRSPGAGGFCARATEISGGRSSGRFDLPDPMVLAFDPLQPELTTINFTNWGTGLSSVHGAEGLCECLDTSGGGRRIWREHTLADVPDLDIRPRTDLGLSPKVESQVPEDALKELRKVEKIEEDMGFRKSNQYATDSGVLPLPVQVHIDVPPSICQSNPAPDGCSRHPEYYAVIPFRGKVVIAADSVMKMDRKSPGDIDVRYAVCCGCGERAGEQNFAPDDNGPCEQERLEVDKAADRILNAHAEIESIIAEFARLEPEVAATQRAMEQMRRYYALAFFMARLTDASTTLMKVALAPETLESAGMLEEVPKGLPEALKLFMEMQDVMSKGLEGAGQVGASHLVDAIVEELPKAEREAMEKTYGNPVDLIELYEHFKILNAYLEGNIEEVQPYINKTLAWVPGGDYVLRKANAYASLAHEHELQHERELPNIGRLEWLANYEIATAAADLAFWRKQLKDCQDKQAQDKQGR